MSKIERRRSRLPNENYDEPEVQALRDCTNAKVSREKPFQQKDSLIRHSGVKAVPTEGSEPASLKSAAVHAQKGNDEDQVTTYIRKKRKSEGDLLNPREAKLIPPRSLQPVRTSSRVGVTNRAVQETGAHGQSDGSSNAQGRTSQSRRNEAVSSRRLPGTIGRLAEDRKETAEVEALGKSMSRSAKSPKNLTLTIPRSLTFSPTSSQAAPPCIRTGLVQEASGGSPSQSESLELAEDMSKSGGSDRKKTEATLLTNFIQDQRALFADVDAFELDEEESESQDVEPTTQTDES